MVWTICAYHCRRMSTSFTDVLVLALSGEQKFPGVQQGWVHELYETFVPDCGREEFSFRQLQTSIKCLGALRESRKGYFYCK